ncbi:hypothetical protein I2I05_14425 [Hymenobacter sp. BT683]|uniref:DUF3997 domain-containing protein n=1 Tax=Hymenobacter jeongseonensis TaxID=2791027 RepID=A0ABS0IJP9_9BACT|nr:hypothetical protein [Hymenobacter jeongseonensis]MBF9238599.1 hypothetical protein [Hymenobacter jeongseonensis]
MIPQFRLCFVVILLLLTGCDYYDSRLSIINESRSAICVETYKDTIPEDSNTNQPAFYLSHEISPGDTSRQTIPGKEAWVVEIATSKNRRLNMFVYQSDTVRKYRNMAILKKKRLFQRISLTQEQLERNNWLVKISNE